jgi:peptidoglycan hydrolase CwlO-like protein
MVKKITAVILSFIIFLSIFSFRYIYSAECDNKTGTEKVNCLQAKLQQLKQQKNTLSSQIQYMDTQISLTTLLINQTEQKIDSTQKEIEKLGSRIEGLDDSLNYLSELLITRIVEGYKKRSFSVFNIIFDNNSANDFLGQIKYLKTVQDNNQKLLYTVQETKSNAEEQKKLREDKKVELDKLTETLNFQNQSLNNQKIQKQKLLNDTQSDETTYQRLLALAQAQLSGFKSFVSSAGAGVIGANQFGTGSDGSYYSQRDERWANQTIGYSSENILSVGCLLTSVAMVAKHYGDNMTPNDIASDPSRFYGSTAYMSLPWKSVAGRSYYGGVNIDQELQNGNYVIVGVGGCSSGGSHFVVLTKKDGDDYIMNDPIYGPDLKFSSHYSNICSTGTFK